MFDSDLHNHNMPPSNELQAAGNVSGRNTYIDCDVQ